MVLVATASGPFEAKLIAARLGADGIVWELRGGADGIYPMGAIDVLVAEEDADVARALLAPEDDLDGGFEPAPSRIRPVLLLTVVLLSLAFVLARIFGL